MPQDGKKIIGYRDALVLPITPKKMVIVGSGAIGVEFAYFYNAMGSDITIVEFMPNIVPVEDVDVSKQLERSFKKSGIKVMTNSSVEKVDKSGVGCKVFIKTKTGEEIIECDVVLSAAGIVANIENIGLEEVGIKTDKGKILVEAAAKEDGYEIKVGKFPFTASGKASAAGHKDGFVKVIFDAKYGEWLGCHMIGHNVTEMIAEAVLARKLETTGHEVLKAIHPHPTMSEAVMEAVADAYDEVIHI